MLKQMIAVSSLAAILAAGGASAQTADTVPPPDPQMQPSQPAPTMTPPAGSATEPAAEETETAAVPPPQEKLIVEQQSSQVLSAELIGADVVHPQNGPIGSLDSILFDENDQIVGGVVKMGGFLGIGAKRVALSWDEFEVRPAEGLIYLDLTREQLDAAPAFKDRATLQAEQEAAQYQQQQQ